MGGVYEHDGRRLKVFQAIEGGVLVCKELDFDSSDFKDVLFHSMDVFIETSKGYVDNEMLASGQYEYVGPLTYETVEKQTRTIRRFKQVQ